MTKEKIDLAQHYHDKGWSNRKIALGLGVNESTVRRALKKIAPKMRRRVTIVVFEECA